MYPQGIDPARWWTGPAKREEFRRIDFSTELELVVPAPMWSFKVAIGVDRRQRRVRLNPPPCAFCSASLTQVLCRQRPHAPRAIAASFIDFPQNGQLRRYRRS